MGSYLSQPITEKLSADGRNEYITFGSSSMQGWRVSQEDAHNCCADFGKNASFFAVYDGHGGAEVALYCAQKLPEFLKSVEAYGNGDFEKALKDAFIGFDSTLIDAAVVEELKKLASDVNDGSETEDDADDEENLEELWKERDMDLDAVLEKYKGKTHPGADRASDAKPSPFLKARRNCVSDASSAGTSGPSSSNCSRRKLDDNEDAVSSTSKQKTEETGEAASSSGSGSSKAEGASDPSSTNETTKAADKNCSPVSSSTSKLSADVQITNGDGSTAKTSEASQENEISTNSAKTEKVSSSSQSGSQSNGEISSNSIDKPAGNSNISSTKDFDSAESSTDDDEYNEDKSSDANDDDDEEEDEDEEDDDDEENVDEEEDDGEGDMYSYDDEDEGFLNSMVEGPGQSSGCTAVVALQVGRELFVANAGDSRCVLCRNGKTVEMSFDHKPEDPEESTRIMKAGGRVTMDGRVNGGLNLSRAIGDHAYKMNKDLKPEEQMISAMPDVKRITLQEDDEFMVLACDGIWNYMSSEEVVEFVRKRIGENRDKLSSICEDLFTNCLAPNTAGDGTGCDNMTAVIVQFKQILPQTEDPVPNNRKRAASPVSAVSSDNELHKRMKTSDEDNDAVAVIEPTTS